jgi:hypothetical protein
MADYHRVVRSDGIEVAPVERSSLPKLGVVVLEPDDPFPRRRLRHPFRDRRLDGLDAAKVAVHVNELGDTARGGMGVRVDEARGNGHPPGVDGLRL